MAVIVGSLLSVASAIMILSCIGLVVMRDPIDKLHYVGPVTTLVPFILAGGIVYEEGFTSQAGLKAICIALVMLVSSPLASYVTLRALVVREHGDLRTPDEPILQ